MVHGLWVGVEAFMNRSEFRDKMLDPLRVELASFTNFYVGSRQSIKTSTGATLEAIEISGMDMTEEVK